SMTDRDFTRRLPGLRAGFDVVSPAARDRLRADVEARLGRVDTAVDPADLGRWLSWDQAGREAVEALAGAGAVMIPAGQRWRLVLGRRTGELPSAARRAARTLDELYGVGRGEGSREIGAPAGGGREAAAPSARVWAEELTDVFGAEVCQEVLGE